MLYLVPVHKCWSSLSISTEMIYKTKSCDLTMTDKKRENGAVCFWPLLFRNIRFSSRPWQKFLKMNSKTQQNKFLIFKKKSIF